MEGESHNTIETRAQFKARQTRSSQSNPPSQTHSPYMSQPPSLHMSQPSHIPPSSPIDVSIPSHQEDPQFHKELQSSLCKNPLYGYPSSSHHLEAIHDDPIIEE